MYEKQLEQLGFSDKEAKVYIASLELGSDTVQEIAKRAVVNRSTTHIIIENLIKKGLMSSISKNKKTFYQTEDPKQLLRLLKEKEEEIKKKEEEFRKYLPELETLYNLAEEKPKVRFFEGKEGIISVREDYFNVKNKNIVGFYAIDEEKEVFSDKEREDAYKERINRNIQFKILYTNKEELQKSKLLLTDLRFIPKDKFPLSSGIVVYDNKVGVFALKGKLMGVIIESKEISNTLKSVFNLAWEGAEKYQK